MPNRPLRELPLFKEVSDEIMDAIAPVLNEEGFGEGEAIFAEGSSSDRFFIITDGEVEIRKAVDDAGDRFKLIAVLDRGEFFGEMAVFLEQPRTASAIAKTAVSVVSMRRTDLLAMFARSPEAAFKVMGLLTSVLMDRLKNTTKELVTVYETGRLVTSAWSMEDLSSGVLDSVLRAVEPAEAGLFVLWNEFNEEYEVFAERGFEGMALPAPLSDEDPVVALLLQKGEPFVSFDVPSDTRLGIGAESIYAGRSLVAAPFFLSEALLGFMVFVNRTEGDAFSYNHMVLLSAIAGYVSVAVENMRFIQAEVDRARLSQGKSSINT
jgi:hypothetical protein